MSTKVVYDSNPIAGCYSLYSFSNILYWPIWLSSFYSLPTGFSCCL